MKIRGFLVILLLVLVLVYFLWFAKAGKNVQIKEEVEALGKVKVKLTRTNMITLERAVVSYMAQSGEAPKSLRDLASFNPMVAGQLDAWGKEIKYQRLSVSQFRLTSAGQDGAFGTEDDIVIED